MSTSRFVPISYVFWNCRGCPTHDYILIASIFPTLDLTYILETWEKDGIGIAKIHGHIYFYSTRYGNGNKQLGTITRGREGIVLFVRKSICRWVSHLPSTLKDTQMCIRIHKDIGLSTNIYIGVCYYFPLVGSKSYNLQL